MNDARKLRCKYGALTGDKEEAFKRHLEHLWMHEVCLSRPHPPAACATDKRQR